MYINYMIKSIKNKLKKLHMSSISNIDDWMQNSERWIKTVSE